VPVFAPFFPFFFSDFFSSLLSLPASCSFKQLISGGGVSVTSFYFSIVSYYFESVGASSSSLSIGIN